MIGTILLVCALFLGAFILNKLIDRENRAKTDMNVDPYSEPVLATHQDNEAAKQDIGRVSEDTTDINRTTSLTNVEQPTQNNSAMNKEYDDAKLTSIAVMTGILNQLGCQPETLEDGNIRVKYQGENFLIIFYGAYIRIWDNAWLGIKKDEPDLVAIRQAVNDANYQFGPTIVMSDLNDEGKYNLHSRIDILFYRDLPEIQSYIQAMLGSFFETKQNFKESLMTIKSKENEQQNTRHTIGLNTDDINPN